MIGLGSTVSSTMRCSRRWGQGFAGLTNRARSCMLTYPQTTFSPKRGYPMKLSNQIKPISYLKAHAARSCARLGCSGTP